MRVRRRRCDVQHDCLPGFAIGGFVLVHSWRGYANPYHPLESHFLQRSMVECPNGRQSSRPSLRTGMANSSCANSPNGARAEQIALRASEAELMLDPFLNDAYGGSRCMFGGFQQKGFEPLLSPQSGVGRCTDICELADGH